MKCFDGLLNQLLCFTSSLSEHVCADLRGHGGHSSKPREQSRVSRNPWSGNEAESNVKSKQAAEQRTPGNKLIYTGLTTRKSRGTGECRQEVMSTSGSLLPHLGYFPDLWSSATIRSSTWWSNLLPEKHRKRSNVVNFILNIACYHLWAFILKNLLLQPLVWWSVFKMIFSNTVVHLVSFISSFQQQWRMLFVLHRLFCCATNLTHLLGSILHHLCAASCSSHNKDSGERTWGTSQEVMRQRTSCWFRLRL